MDLYNTFLVAPFTTLIDTYSVFVDYVFITAQFKLLLSALIKLPLIRCDKV